MYMEIEIEIDIKSDKLVGKMQNRLMFKTHKA